MAPEVSVPFPTNQPEALKSFVEGREQFHIYLNNGSSDELERASQLFQEAVNTDPNFDLAVFYHALTRNELRDQAAIAEFQGLIAKGVEFLPQAYLHLAYAYTKNYRDETFYKAEQALDKAKAEAKRASKKELEPLIEAYRVFLYSVMGGRLRNADPQTKKGYIDKAIELGKEYLHKNLRRKDRHAVALIKLELHNAIGIAYMRKGEQSQPFSKQQRQYWSLASKHFQEALALGMNPVRVRQNMGTLLRIQGRQFLIRGTVEDRKQGEEYFRKAIQEYQISIAINPLDQFPHHALAWLYARLGQWDLAQERVSYGLRQKGAVDPASWEKVKKAIAKKDSSVLDEVT